MPQIISGTETFTNGPYQRPVSRDTGDVFSQVIEEFMERMAAHDHTGADSKDISLNIAKDVTIYKGGGVDFTWNSLGGGNYVATIPLAGGSTYNGNIRRYFYAPSGELINGINWKEFYPTTQYNDVTSFFLFANDNTIDLKIVTV